MIKIAKHYGIIMMAGFIGFFLIMYMLGLAQNHWLRLFFIVIHMGVLTLSINLYRHEYEKSIDNPLSGVATGMVTSIVGVVGFCIFLFLFLTFDPHLMAQIDKQIPLHDVTPIFASTFMLVEGVSVGVIGSYLLTRLIDDRLSEEYS